jgi:hypothetical protein
MLANIHSTVNNFVDWPHSGITADMWSHEMVPCPLFSRTSKMQLCVCGVFRKKVTVVKGSCLQVAEIKNVVV